MRASILSTLLLFGLVRPAFADATLEGTVTNLLGKPVPQVRVHVITTRDDRVVTTDAAGHYEVVVAGDQDVSIIVRANDVQTFRRSHLADGTRQRIDFALEIADGEVIHVVDGAPLVPPKRIIQGPRVTPPYSPEAIQRDAWAKAWLYLDVSETGKVLRVKLVKRPGFGLDEIAVKEAMKLQFAPALDANGRPMRTQMFWAIEWPAHGWLRQHFGLAFKLPEEASSLAPAPDAKDVSLGANAARDPEGMSFGQASTHQASSYMVKEPRLAGVRCAGSGPLNLDLLAFGGNPVYRDCSTPNPKKLPYLPWLDGTQPIPPDAPEIAEKPEAPLQLSKASYIPQITMSAVTATLLATWIYSYIQYDKYDERVVKFASLAGNNIATADDFSIAERYRSDVDKMHHWQKVTFFVGMGVVASAGVTGLLWFRHQRKADFSVQPENGGASVTLGGHF